MVGNVLPISKTLDHTHLITTKPCTDVANLLKSYGFNTTSYLALEKDKEHYFSPTHDACISYVHYHKVSVVAGEPVCKPELMSEVLDEYLSHCQNHQEYPIFFEVSASALTQLKKKGFHFLKTGEEPFFDLRQFSLKGNRMANVRSSAKTAMHKGVQIRQFRPLGPGAEAIAEQLKDIDQRWLHRRGMERLKFTLGSLSLENPGDRVYFLAEREGEVVAFVTYAPIYMRKGVYLDLMRRCDHAPTGTMDLLLTTSFRLLQEMGIEIVTMGMVPFISEHNSDGSQNIYLTKMLQWLYQYGEQFYPFSSLYKFKAKFHPHWWESKYLAYQNLGIPEINALAFALMGKTPLQIARAQISNLKAKI
jgi:phosphatidylglycerol lysyltransferase